MGHRSKSALEEWVLSVRVCLTATRVGFRVEAFVPTERISESSWLSASVAANSSARVLLPIFWQLDLDTWHNVVA